MSDIDEKIIEDEVEEAEVAEVQKPDPEAEKAAEEARKYGWRPKEEFRGDLDGWVDAKRFLELPSTDVKKLRDELKSRDTGFEDRLKRLDAANKAAMERALEAQKAQYQRDMDAIKQQQRQAVESADPEAYDRLERQREAMKPPEQPEAKAPENDPFVVEYAAKPEGAWLQNPIMTDAAYKLIEARPDVRGKPHRTQLEYAETELRKMYPAYFPAKEQPRQRVDEGGLGAPVRGRKGFSDMPREAQAACAEYERDHGVKRDDYVKSYWEQEA